MGLKEDMIGEWARHYDTLLWTITYIFLALDGALLVHCSEDGKFRTLLALGGISLNFITVNLVASVRELRHRIGGRMDEAVKETLHEGRKLYQWSFFIFIFVLIALGWIWLLVENIHVWQESIHIWLESIHDGVCVSLIVVGIGSVVYMAWLGWRYWTPRARDRENDHRGVWVQTL